jgi:heat shock protein HtpX
MGFGGAFISLAMSKMMAKWSTGARIIDSASTSTEFWLVETVRKQAEKAGIAMPEVAIYEGEPNAFATGPSKNNSLVAVSTGLLQGMSKEEVEAVLAHEVSHVANGDMVTLTLIQGVVNTFVIFLSRIVGYLVDSFLRRGDSQSSGPGIGYMITVVVCDILFGILASIIVAWFSRQREFRADAPRCQWKGCWMGWVFAAKAAPTVPIAAPVGATSVANSRGLLPRSKAAVPRERAGFGLRHDALAFPGERGKFTRLNV